MLPRYVYSQHINKLLDVDKYEDGGCRCWDLKILIVYRIEKEFTSCIIVYKSC